MKSPSILIVLTATTMVAVTSPVMAVAGFAACGSC